MTAFFAAFLPVAMMVLMFTLGLRLAPEGLAAEVRAPRALGTGLVVQMFGLPVLAFAIGHLAGLSAPVFAGLMLLAASPGGVTSNYVALLARGRVALSVAMTLATSLLAPLSLPAVLLAAGVAAPDPAGLWKISLGMSAVAVLPMAAGMVLRGFAPAAAARLARGLGPVAKALFALMVLATFVQNWSAMQRSFGEAGPAVTALAVAAPLVAAAAAWAMSLDGAAIRTIAVEASMQNVAVTIFVAGRLLGAPEMALPGLIYAVLMNLVALVLIGLGAREAGAMARTPQ